MPILLELPYSEPAPLQLAGLTAREAEAIRDLELPQTLSEESEGNDAERGPIPPPPYAGDLWWTMTNI